MVSGFIGWKGHQTETNRYQIDKRDLISSMIHKKNLLYHLQYLLSISKKVSSKCYNKNVQKWHNLQTKRYLKGNN